jgi:hypothetical protein
MVDLKPPRMRWNSLLANRSVFKNRQSCLCIVLRISSMKMRFVAAGLSAVLALLTAQHEAMAEDFSCRMGTRGACLSYGDSVCPNRAKCVDKNAQCFESYTCGYGGFVCKNEIDELARKCQTIASDYDDLAAEYKDLLDEHTKLRRRLSDMQLCLASASSLNEATYCGI